MYTQEQILDMYFERNQQAVSATSQMYGAKLTRFADTMIAHEDALECVNDTYIAAWNKIPPERPMRFLSWLYRVCRNIVCDRIDWNNASKRNSNMNCMLDELEECLADMESFSHTIFEYSWAGAYFRSHYGHPLRAFGLFMDCVRDYIRWSCA